MQTNKLNFNRFIIEIFSIVFSVMLALSLNEWRQSYNRNKDVSRALNLVKSEIIENKKGMETTIANQIAYRDSFKTILFSKSRKKLKNQSFARIYSDLQKQIKSGLQISPMLSTAWITAKEIGIIQDIDYSLAMLFSEMEEQKKLINYRFQAMTDLFYGYEFFKQGSAEKFIGPAFVVLTDLISSEQELVEIYDKILKKIE